MREIGDRLADPDAGIVDEDVEPLEPRDHGPDGALDGGRIANVTGEPQHPSRVAALLGERVLGAGHASVGCSGDRHSVTAGQEPHRQGLADPAGAAGDEGDERLGGHAPKINTMRLVTIVVLGAGEIAAATARQLAAARLAARVIMVDEAASVARGKALDIAQAGPVDRYDTALIGTDDESAVVGAGAIVLADRAGGGEWADEAGLALVRRLIRLNEQAPVVCAGVRQRSIVDRAVHEAGLPRARIFGTAPEALRGAIAAMVALETEVPPGDVALLVVGRAPDDIIVSWDSASLNGHRALDMLPPAAITRLDARARRLWPPGPHALGSAATRVIRSMLTRAARTHVLEVALTRDEAAGGHAAMLPARVGPRGIVRLEPAPLSARDRVRLDSALAR